MHKLKTHLDAAFKRHGGSYNEAQLAAVMTSDPELHAIVQMIEGEAKTDSIKGDAGLRKLITMMAGFCDCVSNDGKANSFVTETGSACHALLERHRAPQG